VDIVLGVSMASTAVRMVLVEGANADGATVEEDTFGVAGGGGSATSSAPEQVIAAILGTRQGAAEGGYRLTSTGVTWTETDDVAALREALAAREINNVMLVSPLLAAAALAQTVGQAMGYESTALLFVEPRSVILAVVRTVDGSIVGLQRRQMPCTPCSAAAIDALAAMVATLDRFDPPPGGVFVVGCGVDIAPIKSHLEAAVALPVSAPEEPAMALARGAALASADAPLFASSTAAVAYAQDPGTGEVNPDVPAPRYFADAGSAALAYSAVADEVDPPPRPRRGLLLASAVAAIFAIGLVALVVSVAVDIRPAGGRHPGPQISAVPIRKSPAPPVAAPPAPPPSAAPASPAPPPSQPPQTITAPTPVVQQSPQRVVSPPPAQQTPVRRAPAYVPPAPRAAPPPEAPAPPAEAPAPPPPAAPAPPPAPQLPPMVMYLHLPFVTVPIPINPPPPPPPGP
jgi:hypothetical protein